MAGKKKPVPTASRKPARPGPPDPLAGPSVQEILAAPAAARKPRARKRETAKSLGVYESDQDILDQYLHEVSLTPLLTP